MNGDIATSISAIILAGGMSTRLGQDKALVSVGGEPLLVRVVERLSAFSDDLIVVTGHEGRYKQLDLPARLIPDERQGVGALMGLYSGLKVMRHAHAVATATDMPLLNLSLLRYMARLAPEYDVVVPRVDGYVEPLHAIYGKACLSAMEGPLARGQRRIVSFFSDVRVRYVEKAEVDRYDPRHLSFVNVNTPEDWLRVQSLLDGA